MKNHSRMKIHQPSEDVHSEFLDLPECQRFVLTDELFQTPKLHVFQNYEVRIPRAGTQYGNLFGDYLQLGATGLYTHHIFGMQFRHDPHLPLEAVNRHIKRLSR